MKVKPQCCWECKYFQYSQKEADWSEYTLGSDFTIYCVKNVWEFDAEKTTREEFRKILSTAKTCIKFEAWA